MVRTSKRRKELVKMVELGKTYSLKEAIAVLKKSPTCKFDESIDIAMHLNINPKQITQPIRGTVALTHGTGKKVIVCCLCRGEDEKKAKDAGADFVGSEEIIAKIAGGWYEFDVVIATPDMMRDLSKLGKILGPKGLMPNPKSGTVTTEVAKTIKEIKAGKIEYKMDKQAGIHASVGKLSFDEEKICDNVNDLINGIISANAQVAKPQAIRSIAIAKTMGPGLQLDVDEFIK